MNNWQDIFEIQSETQFEEWAMKIFNFQYENTPVYTEFCNSIGRINPQSIEEIPFLPISFFKTHTVCHKLHQPKLNFKSSGTTGQSRSIHPVVMPEVYEKSFLKTYINQIGDPKNQVILALLPSYIEQGESSLVYMVDRLVKETKCHLSGFLLNQPDSIKDVYNQALALNKQVVVFGVSYALLDLAEKGIDLSQAIIMETGGMKGRRKEMTKKELHHILKKGLKVKSIASEYGMTELFSQGYALEEGLFKLPSWMKIYLREINDPFSNIQLYKTGGIRVIDLANVFSCSFIDTQDLGRLHNGKLELMGRYDSADMRGCNLMVE